MGGDCSETPFTLFACITVKLESIPMGQLNGEPHHFSLTSFMSRVHQDSLEIAPPTVRSLGAILHHNPSYTRVRLS